MKSTIKTLVVAMVLGTASVAAAAELSSVPVRQKDTSSATATTAAPLHALSRLDAQSLEAQEMTDEELKAVEGGTVTAVSLRTVVIDLSFLGQIVINTGTTVQWMH